MFLVIAIFGWMNIYGASVSEDQVSIFELIFRAYEKKSVKNQSTVVE